MEEIKLKRRSPEEQTVIHCNKIASLSAENYRLKTALEKIAGIWVNDTGAWAALPCSIQEMRGVATIALGLETVEDDAAKSRRSRNGG